MLRAATALALLAGLFAGAAQAQVRGQFVSDSKTGCKFWWPTQFYGDVLSFHWNGACVKGLASGRGSFELVSQLRPNPPSTATGEGEAIEGKLNGRAFVKDNVWRREGEFRDGVLNGRGIYTYDGILKKGRYEGEFRNGDETGVGVTDEQVFTTRDGPPVIVHKQVDWVDWNDLSKLRGKGILVLRMAGCSSESRYEGEMVDDMPDGRGTLKAPDGQVYSGVWEGGSLESGGRKIDAEDYEGIRKACRK